jgi:hypothetical protein
MGFDWRLVLDLAADIGLPRPVVTALLPAAELGLLVGPPDPDEAGLGIDAG